VRVCLSLFLCVGALCVYVHVCVYVCAWQEEEGNSNVNRDANELSSSPRAAGPTRLGRGGGRRRGMKGREDAGAEGTELVDMRRSGGGGGGEGAWGGGGGGKDWREGKCQRMSDKAYVAALEGLQVAEVEGSCVANVLLMCS
jgi:hypothetical protein